MSHKWFLEHHWSNILRRECSINAKRHSQMLITFVRSQLHRLHPRTKLANLIESLHFIPYTLLAWYCDWFDAWSQKWWSILLGTFHDRKGTLFEQLKLFLLGYLKLRVYYHKRLTLNQFIIKEVIIEWVAASYWWWPSKFCAKVL